MEQPDRSPQEAVRDAISAAQDEIQEDYPELGVVLVATLPPDFNSVRYASNIPNEGVVSLLQATAQQIAGRMNTRGDNSESNGNNDSNLITP